MNLQPTKSTVFAYFSTQFWATTCITYRHRPPSARSSSQTGALSPLNTRSPSCTPSPPPLGDFRSSGDLRGMGSDHRVCPSRLAFLRILLSRSVPAVPCVRMSFHPFSGWLAGCFLNEHFLGGKRVSVCPDLPGVRCPACLSPGALPCPRASLASLCGSVRQPHPDTRTRRLVFLLQISGLGQLLFLWQPFQPALSCHFRVQYLLL